MIQEHKDLFDGLNKLCSENEAFYFSEQDYNEKYIVRSYTYRLASWSDFKLPYAKQCRGTAFAYNKETKEWSLFCRAYPKFFNLGELGTPSISEQEYNELISLDYNSCIDKLNGLKFANIQSLLLYLGVPPKVH